MISEQIENVNEWMAVIAGCILASTVTLLIISNTLSDILKAIKDKQ